MPEEQKKNQIVNSLLSLVEEFNTKFKEWSESTGCVANFQWDYKEGKSLEIKAVENLKLTQVDKILYRHKPPSDKEIAVALGNARKAEKTPS